MQNHSRPPLGRSARVIALLTPLLMGLAPIASAQSDYSKPYAVTTFAGGSGTGSADGTGTAASFKHPYGIALDASGVLFVADSGNSTIRQISTTGVVTTLAGLAGVLGATDATGSEATFNMPVCVAVGSGGDVYVADANNNLIRRVTSSGETTTLAGVAGKAGYVDATGTSAYFSGPYGVAIDSSGNVYVADSNNNVIRKVTQSGVVTTFAGTAGPPGSVDGAGSAARFRQPLGLTIDGSGNLYVADTGNHTIRKVTPGALVTTVAGSPGVAGSKDGAASAALFNSPRGLAVDGSGNIFVADSGNSTVRMISSAGEVTTLAGSPGSFATSNGTGAAALLDVPVGVAVDAAGTLYISEELADSIDTAVAAAAPTTVAPAINLQPASQTVSSGSTVVFKAGATGTPAPTYQWFFNGTALSNTANLSGATGPTLVITGSAPANEGSYFCAASNSAGSVQSAAASLAVSATADIGRLIDLSCRSEVGTGAEVLIAGFAVGGAGTSGVEPLLVRASGPALAAFDVSGTLPDPQLEIYSGSTELGANSGWGGNATITATAASVGAFPWTSASSHDSALIESLPTGAYTAEVLGQSGDTGVALVEVYDATPPGTYAPTSARLVNISARTQVGTGANVLIAGFVIGGSTSRTVLIRASGPALIGFGVSGTLPDPELQLFASSTLLAANTAWGGDAEIASAAANVGAFPWASASSSDSAILVTLPPGAYTAQVSGASGDTGVALIEVYEVH